MVLIDYDILNCHGLPLTAGIKSACPEVTPQLNDWDTLLEGVRQNLEIKCLRATSHPDFPLPEANASLIQTYKRR